MKPAPPPAPGGVNSQISTLSMSPSFIGKGMRLLQIQTLGGV